MKNFDSLTENRKTLIDSETDWMWISKDTGAWEGPKEDWENHHKNKYFKYVKNFDTVITAGANQGMYARLYSKIFNKVYAFEPDPICFHCLVNNCQNKNVIKIQSALGNFNGFIGVEDYIILNEKGELNTGGIKIIDSGIIPIITIDSFNFQGVDLIQLDVEGFEHNVILGAINTIQKFKPIIITETVTNELYNYLIEIKYKPIEQSANDVIWTFCY